MSRTSTGSSSRPDRPPPASLEEERVDGVAIERMLHELGVRPSRDLGQSFLVDPFVADAEAALLDPSDGTPVFEVGGGLGILTGALIRRGARPLTVVERDPRLARFLRRRFAERATVIEADARTFEFPPDVFVTGNLPFSVATPILLGLWKRRVPRIVVMVQKEVAERIAAGPGSKAYGRISIVAALFGRTELFRTVPSRLFHPPPEVEGRILLFEARSGKLPVPSVERLEELVRVLFSSRRKQLGNLLPRVAPSPSQASEWARTAAWPEGWERRRPEELPPEAYFAFARACEPPPRRGDPRGAPPRARSSAGG